MGIRDWFKGKSLQSAHTSGQNVWNSLTVQEPYSGAWQKNDELTRTELTASDAVFSCVSLISKDIGKLPIVLKTKVDGVLVHADIPEKLRVLKSQITIRHGNSFKNNGHQVYYCAAIPTFGNYAMPLVRFIEWWF